VTEKTNKTEFGHIADLGIDEKNRRIYWGLDEGDEENFAGCFNWSSVELCIRALHRMASGPNKSKPIELHMNSAGGSSVDMMRLLDEIEALPCKVIFIGGGMIGSSATWIMAACDERRLHKNTVVQVHDGFSGHSEDRHKDFMVNADEEDKWQHRLNKLYADNSRMPEDFWADIITRDLYLSPEETIMLGLADKIIPPLKRGNFRRARIAALNNHPPKKELNDLVKTLYKRIRRTKVGKIEISFPAEEFDKALVVDTAPVVEANQSDQRSEEPESQDS